MHIWEFCLHQCIRSFPWILFYSIFVQISKSRKPTGRFNSGEGAFVFYPWADDGNCPGVTRECSSHHTLYDIRPKLVLNINLVMSRWPITYISLNQSFCNFAQSTVMILSCSVQDFETIGQLKRSLWTNGITRDLVLRGVSDEYDILHSTPWLIN